jgi:hypothetical protein
MFTFPTKKYLFLFFLILSINHVVIVVRARGVKVQSLTCMHLLITVLFYMIPFLPIFTWFSSFLYTIWFLALLHVIPSFGRCGLLKSIHNSYTAYHRDLFVAKINTVAVLSEFFFIFIFSRFCKNIWSVTNLAKIYIYRRGPQRQGLNAAAHGVTSHQEWAHRPNAMGRGVISLTPWAAVSGA